MNRLTRPFRWIFTCICLFACSPKATFRIIDKPITWNAEREQLSLNYLKERHG